MDAVRTTESNFTYLGPSPEIADLPCRRDDGVVFSVFRFTDEEREMIANGAQLELGIHCEPIPPVSVKLVNQHETVGEVSDGSIEADYRCERCGALYIGRRAAMLDFDCGQCSGELRIVPAS